MSIRLCQSCLHEIKEGDKLCSNCMISVNRHATVIEVMREYEGYSYVSNRYAFHDENLNNFNMDLLIKDSKNARLYPDELNRIADVEEEDFEYVEEEETDFTKNVVKLINNPSEYKDILWGLVGCLLLLIGNFFTIYSNIVSIKNNVYLNSVTVFIIATMFLSVLLIFKHKKKYVLIPTIITGMLLIFLMLDVENIKYLGIGYYIMWIALVLLVVSAAMNTKSKFKKYFLRKSDLSWIMFTFFVSLLFVNNFKYYLGGSTVDAMETTGTKISETIRFAKEEVKTISIDEEHIKLDISLLDSYLVRNDDKDVVVIEISAYNKGEKDVNIKEYLDIYIKHNEKRVSFESEIPGITYFDIASGNETVGVDKCKTLFYAFYIEEKGDSYLNIINKKTNKSFIDQLVALNSKFYVEEQENILLGEGDETSSKAKSSYNIYFKKPSSWSENVYAYIYYVEDESIVEIGKWPGKPMTLKNGMYTFKYDKKWLNKAKVIIVDKENENNMFPEKESLGLKLEGNINIMPNE